MGVQEYALGLNGFLTLAPNPVQAGTPFHITFEPPEGYTVKGALRVVVLDTLGKEVHAEPLDGSSSPNMLDLQLPTGLYYVHLTNGTRWLAGGKVVKE